MKIEDNLYKYVKYYINMESQKTVKMNDKGMITIPSSLRKRHQWKEGAEFKIIEIEGRIEIIPILDLENIPRTNHTKLAAIYDESHDNELELEK
jgi:AbrB family looped-hinge helix DNA binding protein